MKIKREYIPFIVLFVFSLMIARNYLNTIFLPQKITTSKPITDSVKPSPTPTSTPTLSTKENYNWKTYKNDRIGVSFEYPDYYQIEELEIDDRGKYENNPYPEYSFGISFSSEDSRNLKPHPLDEMYFDMVKQDQIGYFHPAYRSFKPSSTKRIGLYEWNRYPEIDCEKLPKDGSICTDIGGGALLSYRIHVGDYEYFFQINSFITGITEDSPDFLRILETTVVSPPQIDTP